MAAVTAKWGLELENGVSSEAESAEDSLKSLQSQVDKDTKALTQMKKAMRQMQAGGSVDISAFKKLQGEIDTTQDGIGKARASFVNLGGDFSKLGKKAGKPIAPKVDPPKGLDDMLSSANALPGPLSKVSKGVSGVKGMVGKLTTGMGIAAAVVVGVIAIFVALVAVLAAVAVATAKATVELLKYTAAQVDAMQAERLRLQGLGTLRRWMRLTAKDSEQMSASISRVASRVPLARAEVAKFATDLTRLGIRGRGAESALEALSLAQAVQGDRGRQRVMMFVRQAGHSEAAMADLLNRVRKELGEVAGGQMMMLSMISTKLGESFRELFSGVDFGPLASGAQRLAQMFTQNTQSGRALKDIIEAMLDPLIGSIGATAPAMERFFNDLVVLALDVAIAIVEIQVAVTRALGPNLIGRIMRSQAAMDVFYISLISVGVVVALLAIAMSGLAMSAIVLLSPILLIAYGLYRGYQAGIRLAEQYRALSAMFEANKWGAIGRNMIHGLLEGLVSGATQVQTAVRGIANRALGEFRNVLGIHSPSTVFAELGLSIPQGVAEGVDRGASEAQEAVDSMAPTPTGISGQGSSSRAVTVGELHIHIDGEGENAEDTARRVGDALREFFDTGMAAEPVT